MTDLISISLKTKYCKPYSGRNQLIGAMFDLVGHFYHAGDFTRMGIIAGNTLASVPDDVVSMQFLGLACLRSGNEQKAVSLFHRAARLMQERIARRRKSGQSPFDSDGEYSATNRCLDEAAQTGPILADAWKDIGMTWQELGYREHAGSALMTALKAKPHFPEAKAALDALQAESA